MTPAASDDALAVLGHADLQRCLQLFAKTSTLEGTAELYSALGTFSWCADNPAGPAVRAALARTAPLDAATDDERSAADAPGRPVRVDLAGFIRLAVDVKSEVQRQRSAALTAAADACGDGDLSDIGSLADTVTTLGSDADDGACPAATPDGGRHAVVLCFEDPPAGTRPSAAAADVVAASVRRRSSAASARSQASSSPSPAGSSRRCVRDTDTAAAAVAHTLRSSVVHAVRMLKGSAGGVGGGGGSGGASRQQRPAAKLWAKCRNVAKNSPARCVREEQASSAFGWPAAYDDSAVTHHHRKTDVFTMLAHMSRGGGGGGGGRMSPTAAPQPPSSTDAATLAQELRSVYISRQGGGLRTTRPLVWPSAASPAAQQAPSSAPGAEGAATTCASRQKPLGAPRCYYVPPRQRLPERQETWPQPVKKRRRPKQAKPAAAAPATAPPPSVPHGEALSPQMRAWVRGTASDAWSTMYAHRKSQKYREQARAQAMRAMMSF